VIAGFGTCCSEAESNYVATPPNREPSEPFERLETLVYIRAGLKRCNRSRGFSAKFARHMKNYRNYKIFRGLNCKNLGNRLP
jgi:hypothetical protein